MKPDTPDRAHHIRSAICVFLVSCAIIILQLALMRILSVTRWHHFSYFVISTALLGYGISGTILSLVGVRLVSKYSANAVFLCLMLAATSVICLPAAENLPLNVQYLLYSGNQIALFAVYNLIVLIPFLFGAMFVGLALMRHSTHVPLIYGCSMLGTAVGGALAVGLMFVMPEDSLIYIAAMFGLVAGALWLNVSASHHRFKIRFVAVVVALFLIAAMFIIRPPLRIDQYKTLSMLQRLENQGDAVHVLTRHSPRGRVDVYSSPRLHYTLFAGLGATSPAPGQSAILRDGELAGTIYEIKSADEATILDHTPVSFPYSLMEKPRVLLLGETGGVNIWLAKRFGASHITVVQPDPILVNLMRDPLSEVSGGVFLSPDVTVVVDEPRSFLERTGETFDIIQIVTAEGLAAGTGGLQSLHEDFLLTTEGIALAWNRLNPRGILSVTRGIQTPPRDSLKLFATFASALESQDVSDPGMHLGLVRNYLAATVLAFRNPISEGLIEPIEDAVNALSLDIEWLPHFPPGSFEIHSIMAGPEGSADSFIGAGVKNILGDERDVFYDEWMYAIRPARDDSPYFYNFFRWESLDWMRETYGQFWFRRLELGYMILVFVLIEAIIIGAALILLPLFWLRSTVSRQSRKIPTFLYFTCLGLGFMFLEMTSILRFTRHLGEPVYATSLMIACYLLSAGIGSAVSGRLAPDPRRGIVIAATCVVILGGFHILTVEPLMAQFVALPTAGKAILAVIITLPLGFFMGWLFPCGLRIVSKNAEPLVPWAWAVNGFASVAAPPLALMLSMSIGFQAVLMIALACYALAGVISRYYLTDG